MVVTKSTTMANYYGAELTSLLVFSSLPLHAVYMVVAVWADTAAAERQIEAK